MDAAVQTTKKLVIWKKKKNTLINCKLSWNNREELVNYLSVEVQKNKTTMERFLLSKADWCSVVVLKEKGGNVGLAHFDL